MRHLILVPMIHSEADLGGMAAELRQKLTEAHGEGAWGRREAVVDAMWSGIRARLLDAPLTWERVRLYQDGLPLCGRELDIVRDVAASGSRNHRLLIELIERGATLVGTESPALLLKEYERVKRLAEAARARAPDSQILALVRQGDELLRARDSFMAARIEATLGEGETGIVFLGLLHRLDELLGDGFEVQHVIHNLPFEADPLRRLKETEHGR